MSDVLTRMRGIVGNAMVWSVGWAVLGFGTQLILRSTGVIEAPVSVPEAAIVGLKVGVGGGIAGAAFSAFIAFAYRNRRLQDISWAKFGVGSAVMTALSITGFVQSASLLGGGNLIEWKYMHPTLEIFTAFGFSAAALSMKVAQAAARREALAFGDSQSAELGSGAAAETVTPRAPAAVQSARD
jgi:hypothetical protein